MACRHTRGWPPTPLSSPLPSLPVTTQSPPPPPPAAAARCRRHAHVCNTLAPSHEPLTVLHGVEVGSERAGGLCDHYISSSEHEPSPHRQHHVAPCVDACRCLALRCAGRDPTSVIMTHDAYDTRSRWVKLGAHCDATKSVEQARLSVPHLHAYADALQEPPTPRGSSRPMMGPPTIA